MPPEFELPAAELPAELPADEPLLGEPPAAEPLDVLFEAAELLVDCSLELAEEFAPPLDSLEPLELPESPLPLESWDEWWPEPEDCDDCLPEPDSVW